MRGKESVKGGPGEGEKGCGRWSWWEVRRGEV